MSTNTPILVAGRAGLALLCLSALVAAGPAQDPAPTPPPSAPAAAADPAPTVLLLSDGRVFSGQLEETETGYTVTTPFGDLPIRRREVEATFHSLREVFEYKKGLTPDNDPDELMELARWCLSQSLYDEASEQLVLVLKLSPGLPQAKSMQFMIKSQLAAAQAPRDAAVGRTGLSQPQPTMTADSGQPGTLSPNMLRELREEYRSATKNTSMPVIFDLPQAVAVKRYREFATFVHPALQRSCANCHNESSNSSFRMILTQARRDMENDLVIRANLDAILPLVDPVNPAQSRLLSVSIMPHPPTNRPVLAGPNSYNYQILSRWVQGLHSPTARVSPAPANAPAPRDDVARASLPTDAAAPGGFARDRNATTAATSAPPAATPPAASPAMPPVIAPPATAPHTIVTPTGESAAVEPTPAGQILPGSVGAKPMTVPPPSEFPTSPLLGGPNAAKLPVRTPGDPAQPAPDPSKIFTEPDGRKYFFLSAGEKMYLADTSKPKAPPAAASDPAAPKPKSDINRSALQKFMSGKKPPATP